MTTKEYTKLFALVGMTALLVQCSKHSASVSKAVAPGQTTTESCASFAIPCSVNHGTGTESCTNSASGPVYGTCENIICDAGFVYNSTNGLCVGTEVFKSFTMLVSGADLPAAGTSSFIAQINQTYDFKITGSDDVVAAGINSAQSYAKYISGQCAGSSYTFQPLTTTFTATGSHFQFGDNNVAYTTGLSDLLGGCTWQVCAVSNDSVVPATCVNMIASVDPLPPTTTTTTTLAPTTTTTLPVTTTTTTLPHPTTTTTLPHPTTTTTTLPPSTTTTTCPPTTTLPHPTTTTTLPHPTTTTTLPRPRPSVTGKTCVGPLNASYNCVGPLIGMATGSNKIKKDPGCNIQVAITYRGQTVNASVFGTGAPYNHGGGIGQTAKTVNIQGVDFHLYIEDEYFITGSGNSVDCVGLVSWPNFPNAP